MIEPLCKDKPEIHHKDDYPLNAQRNTTFIALENALKNEVKQSTEKDDVLKQALERYKDKTHEI
ncbi:hypothetical protein [Providencia rettgeri]|uniref:hypothetical protein n=1 Tax=Providencia rettgeri TaxID=587 RepID=UPI00205F256E|nr:hypothetical protein [Providencia rettgeri]UPS61445.1 hypothetical protein M0M83_12465 [Providencia rettgeri]